MVGCKEGHTACKIPTLRQSLLLCYQLILMETVRKLTANLATHSFGDITEFKTVVSVSNKSLQD